MLKSICSSTNGRGQREYYWRPKTGKTHAIIYNINQKEKVFDLCSISKKSTVRNQVKHSKFVLDYNNLVTRLQTTPLLTSPYAEPNGSIM